MTHYYDADKGHELIVVAVADNISVFSHSGCVPPGYKPVENWTRYRPPIFSGCMCDPCGKNFNAVTSATPPLPEFHPFL